MKSKKAFSAFKDSLFAEGREDLGAVWVCVVRGRECSFHSPPGDPVCTLCAQCMGAQPGPQAPKALGITDLESDRLRFVLTLLRFVRHFVSHPH